MHRSATAHMRTTQSTIVRSIIAGSSSAATDTTTSGRRITIGVDDVASIINIIKIIISWVSILRRIAIILKIAFRITGRMAVIYPATAIVITSIRLNRERFILGIRIYFFQSALFSFATYYNKKKKKEKKKDAKLNYDELHFLCKRNFYTIRITTKQRNANIFVKII